MAERKRKKKTLPPDSKTVSETNQSIDNLDDTLDTTHNSIDVIKALTLRVKNHLSYTEIANRMGVPRATVHHRLSRLFKLIDDPTLTDAYRANKAPILEAVEMKLAAEMLDDDKLQKASLNNIAYSLSQVGNMVRLERNQSTGNINIQQIERVIDDRQAEIERLRTEIGEI